MALIYAFTKHIINFFAERKFRYWDLVVVLVYAALTGFIIRYHEPWSDEAYPWLIARDADLRTFLNIAAHNYDRHPVFFHLCLMPLAKLGLPYFSQAVFNLCLSIVAVLIFFIRSPFSRITKYLFAFSYDMMFEYSVIVRPYTLALTLIFTIAALYPQRFKHPVLYGLIVFFLFHTENICFALAASMAIIFGAELVRNKKYNGWTLSALGIMVMGGVLAFIQGYLIPPDHMDYRAFKMIGYANALRVIEKTFLPFPLPASWSSVPVGLITGILIIFSAVISLIKKPASLFILLFTYAELFYIFIFAHQGDFRHFGFLYVTILVAFWIGQYDNPPSQATKTQISTGRFGLLRPQFLRSFSLLLINICIVISFKAIHFVYILEYRLPFSGAKQMASLINQLFSEQNLGNRNYVIVAKETSTAGLLPFMPDKKYWNPCTQDYLTYYLAKKQIVDCCELPHAEMVRRAEAKFRDLTRMLFLVGQPFQISEYDGYTFQLVTAIDRGTFGYGYERYYLYRPIPKPLPP